MSEPPLRHHMIGPNDRVNVTLVNSNSNPHQHMLRSFHNFSLDLQKVRPLKGFKAKVIIVKVTVIDDLTVQTSSILRQGKKNQLRMDRHSENLNNVNLQHQDASQHHKIRRDNDHPEARSIPS